MPGVAAQRGQGMQVVGIRELVEADDRAPPKKDMPGVATQRVQIMQVAGIRELVEVDDRLVRDLERREDEIGADEAGAAGDEKHQRSSGVFSRRRSECHSSAIASSANPRKHGGPGVKCTSFARSFGPNSS